MGFTSQEIPQEDAVKSFMWYMEGIAIGLLPLIGAFITLYLAIYHPDIVTLTIGLIVSTLYCLEIGACVTLLLILKTRMFGYGLLTMLIASPLCIFLAWLILFGIHVRLVNG
jgi:hypothetical protein